MMDKIKANIIPSLSSEHDEESRDKASRVDQIALDFVSGYNFKTERAKEIFSRNHPFRKINDHEQAFKELTELFEIDEEASICFVVNAMQGTSNMDLGYRLASKIISSKGWDYFLEQTIKRPAAVFLLSDNIFLVKAIVDILENMSTPANFPLTKMEELLSVVSDGFSRLKLQALIDSRRAAEAFPLTHKSYAMAILRYAEIDHWDVDRARKDAAKILEDDVEEYYGLLEDIYANMMEIWSDDDGSPPSFVSQKMASYENMSALELLSDISSVYAMNILHRRVSQEKFNTYFLSEEAIASKAAEVIQKNDKAYQYAAYASRNLTKKNDYVERYFDSYSLIAPLGMEADDEGESSVEGKYGFANNTTLLPISGDIRLLFSPSGRFLFAIQSEVEKEKNPPFKNTGKFMHMADMLSHENRLGERQYSHGAIALAACLCYWDLLPADKQAFIKEAFEHYHIDGEELIAMGRKSGFDEMINVTQDYGSIFTPYFFKDIFSFVYAEIEKRSHELGELKYFDIKEIEKMIKEENLGAFYQPVNFVALLQSLDYNSCKKMMVDFDFDMSEISIRELFQIFLFLKRSPDGEAYKKLTKFITSTKDQESRISRIKSFLSLESGTVMGEVILNIGEKTKDQPEVADKLFDRYVALTGRIRDDAKKISLIYEEVFFEKRIDEHEIANYLIQKNNSLLVIAFEEFKDATNAELPMMIDKLLTDWDLQEQIRDKQIEEYRSVAQAINLLLQSVVEELSYDDLVDIFGDPDKYKTPQELNDAINRGEIEVRWMETDKTIQERLKKFDSVIIKKIIAGIDKKNAYIISENKNFLEINNYSGKDIDLIDSNYGQKLRHTINRRNEIKFGLEKVFKISKELENKLDEIIYSRELAPLQQIFKLAVRSQIDFYQPEIADGAQPNYLPVGISSQLPQVGEIHAKPLDALGVLLWLNNQGGKKELMVVDTIQTSNYQALYHLSPEDARAKAKLNGERDREWYGAVVEALGLDNLEISDYQELEQSPEFKKALALVNDLSDPQTGSQIITRALSRIVEKSVAEKAGGSNDAKRAALLREYGKNEIAFIIAKGGTKIGHEKEYRYDILAKIMPIYQKLKSNLELIKIIRDEYLREKKVPKGKIRKMVSDLESDQTLVELSLYLAYYKYYPKSYFQAADLFSVENQIRSLKGGKEPTERNKRQQLAIMASSIKGQLRVLHDQLKSEEETVKPIERQITALSLLPKGRDAVQVIQERRGFCEAIVKADILHDLKSADFVYPEGTAGMSFEIADSEKNISSWSVFREFYSTYKGQTEEEAALTARQMLASSNPLAKAKLILLSPKDQEKYAATILLPLLVNYYIATSRDRNEAMSRAQRDLAGAQTIGDVLDLIQQKIIWPIEINLRVRKEARSQS